VTQVNLATQVVEFFGQLAPEARKNLRLALRRLEQEKGDIKALEGKLTGYQRLRSGSYRVVFARKVREGRPEIDCIFAEHRALVYELFTAALALQTTKRE
jgi:mRNA-degrading endonuclease RelE of RelBE toxin-antitoxin system